MKVISLFLSLFLCTNIALAQMSGKLFFQELEATEGDTLKAQLMIQRDSISFMVQDEDLELKHLSSALVIVKANSISVNPNNVDVIEADVIVSVIGQIKHSEPLILDLLHNKVAINLKSPLKVNPVGIELPKEFKWLDFSLRIPWDPRLVKLFFSVLTLFLLGLCYWWYKRYQGKKAQARILAEKKRMYAEWKTIILSAKMRSDYEKIYQGREYWKSFIADTNVAKGYTSKVEEHQYKEEWDENILTEVKLHHDRLIKMLEGGQGGI